MHKTTQEGEALLDRILENTPPLEPLHVEPMSIPEEVSSAEAKPSPLIQRPSPEPEDLEEGFQPSDLSLFEDDFFEDFRNTSNYSCQKKPPVPVTPLDPLDKNFLKETVRELTAIMSREWVEEVERSSEEIHIHTPSLPIQCRIYGTWVEVLYNPTIGANLMSASFAHTYLGDEHIAPTTKPFRNAPRSSLEGCEILHNITV
jgi:hypothetical protein